MNLFEWAELYPRRPGWKEPTTSRDAARAIASDAETTRKAALAAIVSAGAAGLTAHECSARLEKDHMMVAPRLSELRKAGKIRPGRYRRRNDSGKAAIAWVTAP